MPRCHLVAPLLGNQRYGDLLRVRRWMDRESQVVWKGDSDSFSVRLIQKSVKSASLRSKGKTTDLAPDDYIFGDIFTVTLATSLTHILTL